MKSAVLVSPPTAPAAATVPTALIGRSIDDLPIRLYRDRRWLETTTHALLRGRTVVLFGLPGAFTPTCSSQHLPRYEELEPTLRDAGVDEVVCISVNDSFVMQAWGESQRIERVSLLADGNAELTDALGMAVDKRELGFGRRSWRYSMLVRDSVIEHAFVEPQESGDPFHVSDADTMLNYLNANARVPDQVLIVTREGCPHCAFAKALLEHHGKGYVEWSPDVHDRGRVVGAIAGARSVPQVFINGRLIGGAQELERHLAHAV